MRQRQSVSAACIDFLFNYEGNRMVSDCCGLLEEMCHWRNIDVSLGLDFESPDGRAYVTELARLIRT